MPFLGIERTDFVIAAKKADLNNTFNAAFVAKFNIELVGDGGECFVIPKTGHPDKVQAIQWFEQPAVEAKRNFYWHRLFSTLFPDNFPHIYAAFGNPAEKEDKNILTGNVRQRIAEIPWNAPASERAHLKSEIGERFDTVWKECEKWNLPLRFDHYFGNFMSTPEGKEFYMDSLELPDNLTNDQLEKFSVYAGINQYSEDDRTIIQRSIDRLKVLTGLGD